MISENREKINKNFEEKLKAYSFQMAKKRKGKRAGIHRNRGRKVWEKINRSFAKIVHETTKVSNERIVKYVGSREEVYTEEQERKDEEEEMNLRMKKRKTKER